MCEIVNEGFFVKWILCPKPGQITSIGFCVHLLSPTIVVSTTDVLAFQVGSLFHKLVGLTRHGSGVVAGAVWENSFGLVVQTVSGKVWNDFKNFSFNVDMC